jgi:hypothetical protein
VETKTETGINEILEIASDQLKLNLKKKNIESISKIYLHKLTHQNICTRFFKIKLNKPNDDILSQVFIKTSWKELHEYAIPRLIDKYIMEEFGENK